MIHEQDVWMYALSCYCCCKLYLKVESSVCDAFGMLYLELDCPVRSQVVCVCAQIAQWFINSKPCGECVCENVYIFKTNCYLLLSQFAAFGEFSLRLFHKIVSACWSKFNSLI